MLTHVGHLQPSACATETNLVPWNDAGISVRLNSNLHNHEGVTNRAVDIWNIRIHGECQRNPHSDAGSGIRFFTRNRKLNG